MSSFTESIIPAYSVPASSLQVISAMYKLCVCHWIICVTCRSGWGPRWPWPADWHWTRRKPATGYPPAGNGHEPRMPAASSVADGFAPGSCAQRPLCPVWRENTSEASHKTFWNIAFWLQMLSAKTRALRKTLTANNFLNCIQPFKKNVLETTWKYQPGSFSLTLIKPTV